jgi:hypothetical protein
MYQNLVSCAEHEIILPNFYLEVVLLYTSGGQQFKPKPLLGEGVQGAASISMGLFCTAGLRNPI